jgi:2-oxoglutarate ferredoxin oxidoreductase subunit alpha
MQEKRLRKEEYLTEELKKYDVIKDYGKKNSSTAILCWGSNKGVCCEAGQRLGLKVIHLQVMWPFPAKQLQKSLKGVKKVICVENNATGQLVALMNRYGFKADRKILQYDGRPFTVNQLEDKIRKAKV